MTIRKDQAPVDRGTEEETQRYGAAESLRYSDAGVLTRFGAYVQTLQPGSQSSDRHWHEEEDEFRLPDQRWRDRTGSPHDVAGSRGRPVAPAPAVSVR